MVSSFFRSAHDLSLSLKQQRRGGRQSEREFWQVDHQRRSSPSPQSQVIPLPTRLCRSRGLSEFNTETEGRARPGQTSTEKRKFAVGENVAKNAISTHDRRG